MSVPTVGCAPGWDTHGDGSEEERRLVSDDPYADWARPLRDEVVMARARVLRRDGGDRALVGAR